MNKPLDVLNEPNGFRSVEEVRDILSRHYDALTQDGPPAYGAALAVRAAFHLLGQLAAAPPNFMGMPVVVDPSMPPGSMKFVHPDGAFTTSRGNNALVPGYCRKCGTPMKPVAKAMDCLRCPECGWSTT